MSFIATGFIARVATLLSKADVHQDGFTLTLWRFPFGPQTYAGQWEDIESILFASASARGARLFLWNKLKFTLVMRNGKTIKVRQQLGTRRFVREKGAFATIVAKRMADVQVDAFRAELACGQIFQFGEVNESKKQAQRDAIRERFASALRIPFESMSERGVLPFEVPRVVMSSEDVALAHVGTDQVQSFSLATDIDVSITLKLNDGMPRHMIITSPALEKPAKYGANHVRNPYLVAQLLAPEVVVTG